MVWAAVLGRADVIRLLVGLGFDINAKGRTDGVGTSEWETALHHAAGKGDLDLVRELIALGADPDIRDTRFGGHAAGLGPLLRARADRAVPGAAHHGRPG